MIRLKRRDAASPKLLSALAVFCSLVPADALNLLVYNASRIYTGRSETDVVEAFCADEKGKIVHAGALNETESICGGNSRTVDAAGHFVFPGFIDSHAHVMLLGTVLTRPDLQSTQSPEEVVEILKEHVRLKNLSETEWLEAFGWNQEKWVSGEFPSRSDLDFAFPETPVWLTRIDGHAGWANSKALEMAGELPSEDPEGGEIIRFSNGTPTGVLLDNAMAFVSDKIPEPTDSRREERLRAALEECGRNGVTGVMEAGLFDSKGLDLYQHAVGGGWFSIRNHAMRLGAEEKPSDGMIETEDGLLHVKAVKFFLDGALGSRGAALLEPYSDALNTSGILLYSGEELFNLTREWTVAGFQVGIHAIGDAAAKVVLDVYEKLGNESGRGIGKTSAEMRMRLEHAQIMEETDVHRLIRLGVIPTIQPQFIGDWTFAEDRLGKERAKGRGYLWQTFLDKGALHLPLGSDFPIEKVRPLQSMYNAVTRKDSKGLPEGGWNPEERLSRFQAFKGFTQDAAFAHFAEETEGLIQPGYWADFVVLDRDVLRCRDEQLLYSEGAVLGTFVGGREVWRASSVWPEVGRTARDTHHDFAIGSSAGEVETDNREQGEDREVSLSEDQNANAVWENVGGEADEFEQGCRREGKLREEECQEEEETFSKR
uniref:Amidohydrolase 3 domain-containing protein n=1 Tax=Chromera velia CCMP2878 TaxID=1169474 RepID=A0A0G4HZX0_9ALVE|eukprot:Cvel_34202.t1-p1 / transcript=Cvel_34202.t1 / gene=Cvel_34202 / organism=Chromera_velia_CCMP2878 / gene_product=Putative amidohydrolase YtcJ, putative / transcript_product=Putative amidohydrolase YtcJ, putative / location=Cvel_scaffold5791:786-2747(+) / protein_length=654 / sequence_SO=supercontig / SO=protein_coding / is_pseudo=false